MNARQFILLIVAIATGSTIALGIAGLYLKSQINSATSGSSTIGSLLSLFAPKSSS
jgi:hypothetical protein